MRPFGFDVQSITLTEGRLSTACFTALIGASVSEVESTRFLRSYVVLHCDRSTRATRKREAGLITSVEIASASVKYRSRRRNGFLQTLRCCARETGDRTEKTSCQYVDVCRRVRNHLSSLKAREKLAYIQ